MLDVGCTFESSFRSRHDTLEEDSCRICRASIQSKSVQKEKREQMDESKAPPRLTRGFMQRCFQGTADNATEKPMLQVLVRELETT